MRLSQDNDRIVRTATGNKAHMAGGGSQTRCGVRAATTVDPDRVGDRVFCEKCFGPEEYRAEVVKNVRRMHAFRSTDVYAQLCEEEKGAEGWRDRSRLRRKARAMAGCTAWDREANRWMLVTMEDGE